MKKKNFKLWRTLTIGSNDFPTNRAVCDALMDSEAYQLRLFSDHSHIPSSYLQAGFNNKNEERNYFAKHFIKRATQEESIKLTVIRLENLGLTNYNKKPYTYSMVCKRAEELGLSKCHPEVAWRLCLEDNFEKFLKEFGSKALVVSEKINFGDSLLGFHQMDSGEFNEKRISIRYFLHAAYPRFILPHLPLIFQFK